MKDEFLNISPETASIPQKPRYIPGRPGEKMEIRNSYVVLGKSWENLPSLVNQQMNNSTAKKHV
jgi:hypothetical protein